MVKQDKIRKRRQRDVGQIVGYIDIDITMEAHTPSLWETETIR